MWERGGAQQFAVSRYIQSKMIAKASTVLRSKNSELFSAQQWNSVLFCVEMDQQNLVMWYFSINK